MNQLWMVEVSAKTKGVSGRVVYRYAVLATDANDARLKALNEFGGPKDGVDVHFSAYTAESGILFVGAAK